MRALASFILRGQTQAILVAVGFAVLSLALPPFSILSGAALALVTLRHGLQQGAMVLAGTTGFLAVLALVSLGNPAPAWMFLTALWLPLWILAAVLRVSRSMALTLSTAAALGMLGVLLTHLMLGDTAAWWHAILLEMFKPAMEAGGPLVGQEEMVGAALSGISRYMTGLMAMGLVLNAVMCLFLARGWQAQLFNPQGFRTEFHALRMGRILSVVTLVLMLAYWAPLGGVSRMAGDMLLVLGGLYLLQGLALAHAVVAMKKLHVGWLVALYVVVFFALPQLALVVVVVGLLDTWVDFRQRLTLQGG